METPFETLTGLTITEITGLAVGSEDVTFKTAEGRTFVMHHSQDYCETVLVEDVNGDVADLIGTPILSAVEESSNEDPADYKNTDGYRDSFTWTFYRLTTIKGTVVVRWLGESNGYYSESVYFVEMTR
jgi:hypothetical protein